MRTPVVMGQLAPEVGLTFQPGVSLAPGEFIPSIAAISIRTMRDGKFGVRLEPGDYQVAVNGILHWLISVPVNASDYSLEALIREVYQKPTTAVDSGSGLSLYAMVLDLWRRAAEWLLRSGGTMTGPLILSAHPTEGGNPLQAATRGYVDAQLVTTARHTHTQTSPAMEWVVIHGLDGYPEFTITDLDRFVIDGEVQYVSTSEMRIRYNSAETGYVHLK